MKANHISDDTASWRLKETIAGKAKFTWLKWNHCVATFSMLALDRATGNLGIAVQSRAFSVGSIVPWVEAEVGCVVTQSFVNVSYGPDGLKMLREGFQPETIVMELTKLDKARDYRQLGVLDSNGNIAAFTGKKCLMWAGSRKGSNCLAIGNILESEDVLKCMVRKFESASDDLAGRLIAALEGGEEAGGDVRGRQSASLTVVGKQKNYSHRGEKLVDLRVDDHPDPIHELKRLLQLSRVYHLIDESEDRITRDDMKGALITIGRALSMNRNIDEAHINLAIILMRLNRTEEAIHEFEEAIRINPKTKRLIFQLACSGMINRDKEVLTRLQLYKENR